MRRGFFFLKKNDTYNLQNIFCLGNRWYTILYLVIVRLLGGWFYVLKSEIEKCKGSRPIIVIPNSFQILNNVSYLMEMRY